MTYRGRIKNGTVVLDEPADLPEGAEVEVVLRATACDMDADTGPSWAEILADFIGKAKNLPPDASTFNERFASVIGMAENLPPDAAINHDHYLYGSPRK